MRSAAVALRSTWMLRRMCSNGRPPKKALSRLTRPAGGQLASVLPSYFRCKGPSGVKGSGLTQMVCLQHVQVRQSISYCSLLHGSLEFTAATKSPQQGDVNPSLWEQFSTPVFCQSPVCECWFSAYRAVAVRCKEDPNCAVEAA